MKQAEKLILIVAIIVVIASTVSCIAALLSPPKPILPSAQQLASLISGIPPVRPIPHIAVAYIRGTIAYSGDTLLTPSVGVEDYIKLLKELAKSPQVEAVVVVIDSPGGDASASYALYKAMCYLAKRKTVVVYTPGTLTSGAYMAALPAERIIASPTAIVGSIGVVAFIPKIGGLLSKLGVRVYVLHEGKLKAVGNPFTENLTESERRVFMSIVNSTYNLFISLVKKHRPNVSSIVFNSAPYPALKALKLGLIDGIGGLEDAISVARKLAGLPSTTPVYNYRVHKPLIQQLLGAITLRETLTNIRLTSPRILLIWPPP